jgi:signal transduction histidine kinase
VNLLDNAVKFSPRASQVLVRTEVGPAGEVRIQVQDHGPGIPADHLPHIFEKFYRAAPAAESGVEGSGLGLVIARQAARAHGGDITASSVVGQGSTFTVVLPAATVAEALPDSAGATAPH